VLCVVVGEQCTLAFKAILLEIMINVRSCVRLCRVQISAAHTRKQLERAVDAFQETREKMEEKAAIRFPNTLDPRSIEV